MSASPLADHAADILARLRAARPLVHHLTNWVTATAVADATLAVGAAPVMAIAADEVSEVAGAAQAISLNLGTPSRERIAAMEAAARRAAGLGRPIVFDPVGVGATGFRAEAARRLLDAIGPARRAILRANADEVRALLGDPARQVGVDARGVAEAASPQRLARQTGLVVAQTGRQDFVTDGDWMIRVDNGHVWLTRITGAGCMASAIVTAFAAVEADALLAAAAALACYGLAAEQAAARADGPGSFRPALLDALHALAPQAVREGVRADQWRPEDAA